MPPLNGKPSLEHECLVQHSPRALAQYLNVHLIKDETERRAHGHGHGHGHGGNFIV